MEEKTRKHLNNCTDETLLTTPKPQASSTILRQQLIKKLDLYKLPLTISPHKSKQSLRSSKSTSSLGILRQSDLKLNSYLNEKSDAQIAQEKWQTQRAFTTSLLENSKEYGLPSYYLKPSDTVQTSITSSVRSDSTVSESDLAEQQKLSFKPDEVSTPRSSGISMFTSKGIAQLSHKIRYSDISLAELCNQYCDQSSFNQGILVNDESFVPGELAVEKLVEEEKVWNKELNALGGYSIRGDSIFSQYGKEQSLSVSDFFRKKSELPELCLKSSPEKLLNPQPLIDDSISFATVDDSKLQLEALSKLSLGITELEDAFLLGDTTAKIAELISKGNKKKSRSTKENIIEENLPLRKLDSTIKIMEPLRDSRNVSQDQESIYFDDTRSVQTASSLDSLPGGKLPIETNRIELVWGCVRVGKRQAQNFTLRNRSQNKLRLQISSSNTCFRIVSDHSEVESVSILQIIMYPTESRQISIVFIPTLIGACVGKLSFSPLCSELRIQQSKKQVLMMYGYGGHVPIEVQNVLKDANMKMWLSLGKLDDMPQLHQKFYLQNNGNISAFSLLKFNSKALYEASKLTIHPTAVVLHPKQQITVTLTYTPTKDDAKHLLAMTNNQVMEIGNIQIITGAEAVRGRIRRLCSKLKQESGNIGNPLIEELSKRFPNEKMSNDIKQFSETVGAVKELMQTCDMKEVTLTLEKDTEQTLVGQIGGIDGSSMFQSLCGDMTTIIDDTKLSSNYCIVEPTNIILSPPTKTTDAIALISDSSNCLQFETHVEPVGVLDISPSEGLLSPHETILLNISCNVKKLQDHRHFKLSVYVDNDIFEVEIKIILLKNCK